MRSLMRMAAVTASISVVWPAAAQNVFSDIGAAMNPAIAAGKKFQRSIADYRNCLAANPTNISAAEGLRHLMDASAQAAAISTVRDRADP